MSRLESVAQQLVARVREDDPEANLRWLRAELGTDPRAPVSDEERLLFMLAGAVPSEQRWSVLTAWCVDSPVDARVDRAIDTRRPRGLEAEPPAAHSGRGLLDELLLERYGPKPRREGHGRAEAA